MSASEKTFLIGVVSEASADREIAHGLAGRVLVERIDWLEAGSIGDLWHWRGAEKGSPFLSWIEIEAVAKRGGRRLVTHGRYTGAFDERRARLALLLFNSLEPRPDAVVFVRDTDNVAERVPSLERARAAPWPFPVLQATPHTKRECWILNGFEPGDEAEQTALGRARQKLGFDPRFEAARLSAKGRRGKKNAKLVLQQGLGVDPGSEREEACWRDTDLEVLRQRGRDTLLAAYLDEVADGLLPILAPSGPQRRASISPTRSRPRRRRTRSRR